MATRRRSRSRSLSRPYPQSPHTNPRRRSISTIGQDIPLEDAEHSPLSPNTRQVRQDAASLSESTLVNNVSAEEEELAEVLAGDDWSVSEADLFNKIRRRGKEALFSATWKLDFGTYPDVLYANSDDKGFLAAINPTMEFRGAQAIQSLVSLGGQVRDRLEINPTAPVEPLIFNEIKRFIAWAEKDAAISLTSLLSVAYNRDKRGTSAGASERTEKRMRALAANLRSQNTMKQTYIATSSKLLDRTAINLINQALAVVYGITVFNCVAALSSFNVAVDSDVKTLVVLDWSDATLDLWNAIAIALIVITARNDILESDVDAALEVSEHPDEDA